MLVDYGLRQYVRKSTSFSKVRVRKPKDAAPAAESDSEKTE